jgi:hypothetical protein
LKHKKNEEGVKKSSIKKKEGASVNIDKQDVLRLVERLSEDELRIVYTFIEEYRIAAGEDERKNRSLSVSENN